jgi:hypothetical protein
VVVLNVQFLCDVVVYFDSSSEKLYVEKHQCSDKFRIVRDRFQAKLKHVHEQVYPILCAGWVVEVEWMGALFSGGGRGCDDLFTEFLH